MPKSENAVYLFLINENIEAMNFIFISPNFPTKFWQFCDALKKNGATVLGIGDAPYEELVPELKRSLTEYYR
jgi:hypothetical protein